MLQNTHGKNPKSPEIPLRIVLIPVDMMHRENRAANQQAMAITLPDRVSEKTADARGRGIYNFTQSPPPTVAAFFP